jgi:hypothetical protein
MKTLPRINMWLYRRIVIHGESFIALLVGLRYMYFCMSKGVWAHDGSSCLRTDGVCLITWTIRTDESSYWEYPSSSITIRWESFCILSCRSAVTTTIRGFKLCAVNAFKLNIRLHHSFSLLLHDERKKGAWNSKCHEEHSSKMDPYWKVDPTTIFCSPNTCGIIAVWCASGSNGCVHEFSQYFSSNDGTIMPRWLDWVAAHRSRQSLVFTPFSRLTWLRLSHHLLAVSRSCPITKRGTRCAFF